MTGTHTGSRTTGLDSHQGGSGASTAKDAMGSATETVKDKGSELQSKAADQVGTVATKVADKADDRRTELADTARMIQRKIEELGSSIAEEQPQVGHAIEDLAGRASRLVDYVESTPVEQMTQDLSTQLRRHPMLFAAGLFGAGFALSRVAKPISSSSSSTGGARELGTTGSPYATQEPYATHQLPTASAVNGGMH